MQDPPKKVLEERAAHGGSNANSFPKFTAITSICRRESVVKNSIK